MTVAVTYTRAIGGAELEINATIGRTDAVNLQESELVSSGGIRDYLFRAEDFIVSSAFVAPRRLDTVTEADGTVWEVVEVPGEPVWRYSDQYKNAIRVHVAKQ